MKITDVEIIPIVMPLAKRYQNHDGMIRMGGIDERLVIKVTTDNGIVGYGDYEGDSTPPSTEVLEPLIGRDPFDFINNNFNLALGMALYDVMGKHLEVPVHKLMGQKIRESCSVAAWTRPCPTKVYREEIRRAVDQGYNVFKMHTSPNFDVFEQTRAAEEVAPEGFRLHWDFTGRRGRTLGAVLPILSELEKKHPIVGYIEDPLPQSDVEGWREIRNRTQMPIVHGGAPTLGGVQEMLRGMADIYMIGGAIGRTLALGHAYAMANIQVILQQTGATLLKALTLHMASVLPTATGAHIICDDQYDEDITTKMIPVTDGFSEVPQEPGLGFEIDDKALAAAAARKPIETPRRVGVVHFPGGRKMYTTAYANLPTITGREEGTIRGIDFEQWADDGSEEFEDVYSRVTKDAESKGWRIT